MEKSISTRQGSLMIFVAMISSKLLSLNSLISYDMKNNAWLVFFISFVFDFLFAMIFLFFIKKINMPFFDYLKKKFGAVFNKAVAIIVMVLFLFKTTAVMVDIYLFFVQLIYAEINRVVFLGCFLTIIFYFGSRKLQSLARSIELLIWLIVFSLLLSLTLAYGALKFDNLLPLLDTNIFITSKNVLVHNLWFGDFWILLFFVGNIKIEKNTTKKLLLAYIISSLICMVFVLVFTSTFGLTASMHRVCVVAITEVTPRLMNQARFNWLVYFTFPIALVYGLGIYSNCASSALKYCIKDEVKSKNTISTLIIMGLTLAIGIVFRFTFTDFYLFVSSIYSYINIVIQYVMPIVLLVMITLKLDKNTSQKVVSKAIQKKSKLTKFEVSA